MLSKGFAVKYDILPAHKHEHVYCYVDPTDLHLYVERDVWIDMQLWELHEGCVSIWKDSDITISGCSYTVQKLLYDMNHHVFYIIGHRKDKHTETIIITPRKIEI